MKPEHRLLAKKPFILGGDDELTNLAAIEIHEAAEKLGNLCSQIRGVPDGEHVTIRGWIA